MSAELGRGHSQLRLTGTPLSRTPSTYTIITQIQKESPSASPRSPVERQTSLANRSREASRKSSDTQQRYRHSLERDVSPSVSPSAIASDSSTSSSSSSEALHPMARSRAFAQRRPRYSSTKAPLNPLTDADDDDEDSPPFLPFSAARPKTPPAPVSPTATVKMSPKHPPLARRLGPSGTTTHRQALAAQTPHSSSSSAQSQPNRTNQNPNPLSALSPKQRRAAKEGSDGTPSMGSSFSDLDDASVTQSALEEALANEMTQGGIGSRMSTISQALRSRYL